MIRSAHGLCRFETASSIQRVHSKRKAFFSEVMALEMLARSGSRA